MTEYRLRTPVSEEEVRKLSVGDIVYLSGTVYTLRDAGHKRALELMARGEKTPVDFRGMAIYHMGPIVKKKDGEWEIVSAGPTTSTRIEAYEYDFVEKSGVRIIIGKGGMGKRTAEACKKFGAVYTVFTGGAGALGAKAVQRVAGVHWLDLGVPEAIWVMEVKDFGPLFVIIDSKGNNYYEQVKEKIGNNLKEAYAKLGL